MREEVHRVGGVFSSMCAAKCLLEEDVEVEILEQNRTIGDVWLHADGGHAARNHGNSVW